MATLWQKLTQEKVELVARGAAILDLAESEDRELTTEEESSLDTIDARMKAIAPQMERVERQRESERNQPGAAEGDPVPRSDGAGDDFRNLGEFFVAVAHAGMPGGRVDPRLYGPSADASGLNSGSGADGGFLVRTDFSTALLDKAREQSVLLPLCSHIPIGPDADGIEAPYISETSRASGSRWGGVRVYRAAEADSVTATKPKFEKFKLELEDLKGLCYATERQLRDATALESIISNAFASEFSFAIDDEIINGTGAGQCEGILNSSALVSVAAEGGQEAATIVAKNIINMRSRVWAKSRSRFVWLINQDIEPELHTMALAVGVGGVPVFMPAGGLSAQPYDTLYARPVVPVEQCATLGTVGDIIAADLSQYIIIEKDGLQSASSMHVRFVYDEMTFKFRMRINGKPKWRSALTPYKGGATKTTSPFVALATRS